MGPVVSAGQMDTILGYIASGTKDGARVAAGGRRAAEVNGGKGYFVRPTVFDGVTPDMKIAREEIFGPVLAALSFDDLGGVFAQAERPPIGPAGRGWTDGDAHKHRRGYP